jgi:hypothetical protein
MKVWGQNTIQAWSARGIDSTDILVEKPQTRSLARRAERRRRCRPLHLLRPADDGSRVDRGQSGPSQGHREQADGRSFPAASHSGQPNRQAVGLIESFTHPSYVSQTGSPESQVLRPKRLTREQTNRVQPKARTRGCLSRQADMEQRDVTWH